MRRVFLGLCLLAAACGGGLADPSGSSTSQPGVSATSPTGDGALRCGETPLPTADPSLYRDTPKYVGNEMPTEEVRRWASQYPDFVDIWIDREHNGWVAAGFTGDVAERQVEIEAEFPGDGVVAVQLGWTEFELADLQTRVVDELDGVVEVLGSSIDVLRGYVRVSIDVLSQENLAAIGDRFAGERICVDGLEPEDVVPPGPQPQAGDGWRLLLEEKGAGFPYETGIAWDIESFDELIADIGLSGDIDADVDFENEVVIWFGAVYGSSCPNIRMDDVVVDADSIYPVIVNTDNAMACTDDANPHAYVVAVERALLPEPPFYVLVDPDLAFERLMVEADFRQPGSTASPDQVGPDPDPPERQPDGSGTIIEPGFPWEYTVDLACGFEAIGEINSFEWVAAEAIPDSWQEAVAGADSVVVEVLLHEGPEPSLEVTFQGDTVVYQPTDEAACPSDQAWAVDDPELALEYWGSYSFDGAMEAETFASLQEMYESVDSVAVVRFVREVTGPSVWLPEESEDAGGPLEYTGVEVEVLSNIKGDIGESTTLMGMRTEDIEHCCPALLFLRTMPLERYIAAGDVVEPGDIPLEATVHRFVNTQGVFIEIDGAVENPMSERNRPDDPVRARVGGMSMAEVIAALES